MQFAPHPKSPKFLDRTGLRYGRLTVLGYLANRKWQCLCDCGNELPVIGDNLGRNTRSCGCLQIERSSESSRTHGLSKSPEHGVWSTMLRRCDNPSQDSYKLYGDRGIDVCERWHSFENFYADMGQRPSPLHSLERIDNQKGYFPKNCRWATPAEQSRNKRNNLWLTFRGKTMILKDWASALGIKRTTLAKRLKKGWGIERALTSPIK